MGLIMSAVHAPNITNECGTLSLNRQSTSGKCQDYIISFHKDEADIELAMDRTKHLFLKLIEYFADTDKVIKARLVMKINFQHMANDTEDRSYHFGSYSAEVVRDPSEFFTRHMYKIVQRLDQFNYHGSNLIMKAISHIHIQLTLLKKLS